MLQQLEFFEIPSPCRGVCQSDSRGYCLGCFRSRDERFKWMSMDDAQKREVLRLCYRRKMLRNKKAQENEDTPPEQPSLF
ncbi:DUF1289 domain-containing protein [Pragia fontium]|uniref:DUF1289 domain-containing protein n=2 Tax=Pragia fontium TaxID=82985 RepID=A0AAJ4WBB4_9GAMM|nr:DUF1289 domain-containing protein [Pragia fontium]AKJ42230.1 oxidoreductase [Pragia fontium]SFC96646.1 hypothetical protein SAMN02745723_10675 [Pragia fontium DSM 5563 = ATCC 49100]SUB82497.1 Predicted Fe-S protein [Pragia fontium]VEJ55399.1 Predicted Fe-S protein [Pragia fontium]GKX61707.1 hypothetical protein SOASR032_02760 [Pragia fontium]